MSSTKVPLLDVGRGNGPLLDEIQEAIGRICHDGRFLHGPDVKGLEEEICEYTGAKHAVGCASGSDALLLSLMALEVGRGDEVIVPSFTFFATGSAVWRLGATPVFIDVDPETMNMDPARLEEAITSRTRAVIPVHLFGQCAEMNSILEIADRHNVTVIEDAAQAIGARYQGQGAGAIGHAGCFSFYPTKNLGGFGDGGMITTNSESFAQKLRLYASHGMSPRYYHSVVGINSRLDSIQAAVLRIKLRHLDAVTQARRDRAANYLELIQNAKLNQVQLPKAECHDDHVWNQFTIRVPKEDRDAVRQHLSECQVGTEVYYPVPIHQQECFRSLDSSRHTLEVTEQLANEVISLPVFAELTDDEQSHVVESLAKYYQKSKVAA